MKYKLYQHSIISTDMRIQQYNISTQLTTFKFKHKQEEQHATILLVTAQLNSFKCRVDDLSTLNNAFQLLSHTFQSLSQLSTFSGGSWKAVYLSRFDCILLIMHLLIHNICKLFDVKARKSM